jgi:nucleotide-binding universal stress UspA family protein
MARISHIIAATDFSTHAERAVRRGAMIARRLKTDLYLIHVASPMVMFQGDELSFGAHSHYQHAYLEPSRQQLEALADSMGKEYGITVQIALPVGRPHTEIASCAATKPGSMIVVGTRGEGGLLNLLLGSTASRLLRVASCPVLVVRNAVLTEYRQVIAAVDFSIGAADLPLLAHCIAPDAKIEILHVLDLLQEARMRQVGFDADSINQYQKDAYTGAEARLMQMLPAENYATTCLVTGYPSEKICDRADELAADLVVVDRHGRSGLEDWLLGSVSKDVVSAASCDVLLSISGSIAQACS